MFTKTQIEAAKEALRTPFVNIELEAMRKLTLNATEVMPPSFPKKPRKARKPRRPWGEMEEIILSYEPPTILHERYSLSITALRHIKSGYGQYAKFGGEKEFWASYRRLHIAEVKRLLKALGTAANDNHTHPQHEKEIANV